MYDIVIPIKPSENNPELRYTLRSIDKYAHNINNVWLIGYSPSWVKNVEIIPINQHQDKWLNTRRNIELACQNERISDDFVLFNDDFILTKPVTDWLKFNRYYEGTLFEKEVEYIPYTDHNVWREGFHFNRQLLILARCGFDEPLNFELHCPIVLNKEKRLRLFERPEFRKYKGVSDPLLFQRSIYLNLYQPEKLELVKDFKLFEDTDEDTLKSMGLFSVSDSIINNNQFPNINRFIESFEKSRFEA